MMKYRHSRLISGKVMLPGLPFAKQVYRLPAGQLQSYWTGSAIPFPGNVIGSTVVDGRNAGRAYHLAIDIVR